jgi:hypothetical protein
MAANLGWCAAFVTMTVVSVVRPGPVSDVALPLYVGLAVLYGVKAWKERG